MVQAIGCAQYNTFGRFIELTDYIINIPTGA